MPTKITGQVSSSNYLSFNGNNDNLTLVQGNIKFNDKANLIIGVGNFSTLSNGNVTNKPAIELKSNYKIGDYLNAQARFREIGGTEQYRIAFGGTYPINKNNSFYATAHATSKKNDNWTHKIGAWLGYTHKFNNGISISTEFQQDIPLNKTSKGVGETIGCFDDSNKMFNAILTVPIK